MVSVGIDTTEIWNKEAIMINVDKLKGLQGKQNKTVYDQVARRKEEEPRIRD